MKSRSKAECPFSAHTFDVILEVLANEIRQDKEMYTVEIDFIFVHRWHGCLCIECKRMIIITALPELISRHYSKVVTTGFMYKVQSIFYIPAINKGDFKLKTQYH